jgi:hypothetical protein
MKLGIGVTLALQTIALVYFFATAKAIIEGDVRRLKADVMELKQEQRDTYQVRFVCEDLDRRVTSLEAHK